MKLEEEETWKEKRKRFCRGVWCIRSQFIVNQASFITKVLEEIFRRNYSARLK